MIDQLERIRHESMEQYGFGTEAMKLVKVCNVCGTVALMHHHFCKECGTALPKLNVYEIYKQRHQVCDFCETIVTDETRFCPQCGRKLKGEQK